MALWRVLSDADRSATVALDMLLFLKRAPPVVCAQWTHFLQEIDNKCADLQIPFEHFHKTAQSMVKGKMSDELLPIGPARDEQQEAASSGDTDATDAQVAARVNWIELCFFLAVQVQHATAASAIDSTTGFPVVLSKKQRELWKKKKVALILDVFASKLGDEQQVCYDGLREMKNGQGKWVFLCDLFLSELREIQIERWLRRKIKIEASSTTPPHVQDGVSIEDVGALLQLLAKTSLSTGTTSSLKSSSFTETELVAAMNEATQRVLEFSNPMLAIQSPIDEEQNVSIRSDDTETSGSDPGFPRKIELQVDEVEKLQIISFILRANYQTRKEQLLECSDVTLGSFESFTKLKNDASAGEAVEDELTTECAKPTSSPVDINVEQLVLATASEASQRAKLSADGSSVHNLLIGPIPDCGDSTKDTQPKEMSQRAENDSSTSTIPSGDLSNKAPRTTSPRAKMTADVQEETASAVDVVGTDQHQQQSTALKSEKQENGSNGLSESPDALEIQQVLSDMREKEEMGEIKMTLEKIAGMHEKSQAIAP